MKTLDQHLAPHGSAARLARLLDTSPAEVSRWRAGKALPLPKTRARIEAFLGPVDWESEALDLCAALRQSRVPVVAVADACGVSRETVYRWRDGTFCPAGEHIPALRRVLGSCRCPECGGEATHQVGSVECLTVALAAARAEVATLRLQLDTVALLA